MPIVELRKLVHAQNSNLRTLHEQHETPTTPGTIVPQISHISSGVAQHRNCVCVCVSVCCVCNDDDNSSRGQPEQRKVYVIYGLRVTQKICRQDDDTCTGTVTITNYSCQKLRVNANCTNDCAHARIRKHDPPTLPRPLFPPKISFAPHHGDD